MIIYKESFTILTSLPVGRLPLPLSPKVYKKTDLFGYSGK